MEFAIAFERVSELSAVWVRAFRLRFILVAPVCFLASWWLVARLAPEAAGSGIPQVMAANEFEEPHHSRRVAQLLGLRTAAFKAMSAILRLLCGGAIGREGPTIQIGAAMFHAVGSRTQRFWPKINHQPGLWRAAPPVLQLPSIPHKADSFLRLKS